MGSSQLPFWDCEEMRKNGKHECKGGFPAPVVRSVLAVQ